MEYGKMRVLIIENNNADSELLKLEIRKFGISSIDNVFDIEGFEKLFMLGKYDAIICEYNLGEKSGAEILFKVRKVDSSIPFIFISEVISAEEVMEMFKQGATNCVFRNHLSKLSIVLPRALKEVAYQKKMELTIARLEESERNYKNAVNDQAEFIYRWLPDGKIVFANASYLKFHELTEEEMLKRNFYELIPENQQERVKNKIASLNPENPVRTDTHKVLHGKYGFYWHEWTDRAFFDEKGRVTVYQSVGRDITIQKNAEITLAQNESRFRMLVENSFDIISICDENGKIIYCSPNVMSILGYDPETILKSSALDLFHPSFSENAKEKFKELFAAPEKLHVFVHKIKAADNEYKIFQTTGKILTDEKGKRTIVFNSIDITEKQIAEKKLKKASEILDLVDSIVLVVEPDTSISYVSPSVKKMLGFEPEELLGKMWWEKTTMGHVFMHKEIGLVKATFANGINDKNKYYERLIQTKDGQLKWIGWEKSMSPNGSMIGVGQDITKKKKSEMKLEESEKYLSTLIESIPDLLFRLDSDGKILDYKSNDGSSFSVRKQKGLKGHSYLEFIPKSVIEIHNLCTAEALQSGKLVSYDFEIKLPDEKSLYYETRIKSNSLNELILVVRDITERKNTESEIQEHHKLLSFSHSLAKIGYYTLSHEKGILFWSEELCIIFEKDFKTVIPSEELFYSLVHKDDRKMVMELISSVFLNPRPYALDYRIVTDSGIEKHLRGTSETYINKTGEKILIGVTQDVTEVKDFESALMQREKQIKRSFKLNKQIIETADQFFYVSSVNPNNGSSKDLTYVSPQVESIFGVPAMEFQERISNWHDAIHPNDFLSAMEEVQMMHRSKKPLTLIYRIKNRKSDHYIWVEDYVCPQLNSKGDIVELYGSVKNIDERKKAEEELLKRESLLRETQRIAKLGTWEWDLSSNKISFNAEMYRMLEISPDKFKGDLSELLVFISPDSLHRFQEAISNAMENYKSEDVNLKIITAKGNEKKILIRGSEQKGVVDTRSIAHGTALDITELWKSHEALFATEDKFKKIFETITDVYFQADLNGICTNVSPSCFAMLGYGPNELIGKDIIFLYEFPEFRLELLEKVKAEGVVNGYETSWVNKSKNIVFVSGNMVIRYDSEGKAIGYHGIIHDVTEKRKNEIEREKLILELTNKYNQLMQFNYIVSHNLRSPITNLLGLSAMFEGTVEPSEQKKVINYIRNSVESMDDLIKDLNMILSMSAAINEHKEDILLTSIFATIKNNLRTQIEESAASIISDIADDNNHMYTIKSYLQSILYNLVNNAIKYRSDERKPVIRISCQRENEYTIISVADNGNGIDLAKFEKQLFGLYKRFDLSKKGRGLGLHMTKTQVEALGGEIKVESELGKGTTFTVTLPN